MTTQFLETASLAKHYWKDVGSEKIDALFNDRSNEINISNLSMVEITEIFNRLRTENKITVFDIMQFMGRFANDVSKRIISTPFYDEHIDTSNDLILKYNLNTLQAINLAIALMMPSNPVFVSADPQLIKAADAEGLNTMNPEG